MVRSISVRSLLKAPSFAHICRSRLVGFAKWQFPYTLTEEQKMEKEASYTKRVPYPEGTNETLYREFFDHLDTLREKHIDESKDYCRSPDALKALRCA